MTFNIVDLIKEQLSDQVMDQISGLIGEQTQTTRSAVGGAVPAILSGLDNLAKNERGAESLFNAFNDHDDSFLDNLGDSLSGDKGNSMIEMGTKILGGLLGNNAVGSIIGALTGLTGMGKSSSSSLIGLLAPIILGVLKRKIFGGGSGGSIGSLTSIFADQKDNINNSMPSGLNEQLTSDGFFDELNADFTQSQQESKQSNREQTSSSSSGGSSILKKLLPLLLLAILAYWAIQFFTAEKEVDQTSQTEVSDLGSQIGSMFDNTKTTFEKITDVQTANQQLPNLKDLVNDFSGFSDSFVGMESAVKEPVITLAKDAFSELEPIVNNVVAIPGVGEVIKPTTESLIEQIKTLLQ